MPAVWKVSKIAGLHWGIGCIVVFVGLAAVAPSIAVYWLIWQFGVAASRISGGHLHWVTDLLYDRDSCLFSSWPIIYLFGIRDAAIIAFGLFIAVIIARWRWFVPFPFSDYHKVLASYSYSLYLIHMPIVTFLAFLFDEGGVTDVHGTAVGWKFCLVLVVQLVVSLAFTVAFGLLFERRTTQFRDVLLRVNRRCWYTVIDVAGA